MSRAVSDPAARVNANSHLTRAGDDVEPIRGLVWSVLYRSRRVAVRRLGAEAKPLRYPSSNSGTREQSSMLDSSAVDHGQGIKRLVHARLFSGP